MKFIIYDFEVFKHDTLLGCKVIDNKKIINFQTWDFNKIKEFYKEHVNDMFIGWNNYHYDDVILESIINDKNPYLVSKKIIDKKYIDRDKNFKLISYDLTENQYLSLKLTELICGKNIHTTDVDFYLDRELTEKEKKLTETYNMDDLNQTYYNFMKFYNQFSLRIDIIKEFNLDLVSSLKLTEGQLAAKVLGAKKIIGIEYQKIKPILYDTLKIKNEGLKNFYLNESFRKGYSLEIKICGSDIKISGGGSHSAEKKSYFPKLLYIDVEGFYNSIMIYYDLLPRSIDEKGKALYKQMFEEQLKLKKINLRKRAVYKKILLAVGGGMNNQYTDFYDPEKYSLMSITGQLFIFDLLEKLQDSKIDLTLAQTNTDGLMLELKNWDKDFMKICDIVDDWSKRTKFSVKKEILYDVYQKDVNNYICKDENGEIVFKGKSVKNYDTSDKAYGSKDLFGCVEPPIIAQGIVNFLLNDIEPHEFVEQHKQDLKLFQYPLKKGTFDYTIYEVFNIHNLETKTIKLHGIDRGFAYNSDEEYGKVYKCSKNKKQLISDLPANILIYNDDITTKEAYNYLKNKIDYNYYINRICDKINEFIK